MSTIHEKIPKLVEGQRLTQEEFLRRWEAMPEVKRAELIGGVVHMPSPLSREHAVVDRQVNTWLGVYEAHTPGCEGGTNGTWLMLDDSPQPDNDLRILPEYGGKSSMQGKYPCGTPEFLAEVCVSSSSIDLHGKLQLYQAAGVDEYLAVLISEEELRWHKLVDGEYQVMPAGDDGIWRSQVFPGLWLKGAALLAADGAQVLATLQRGLQTQEHADFVALLDQRRRNIAGGE